MITDTWMRIALGGHALVLGAVLLLICHHRHRDSLWGRFFRLGGEMHQEPYAHRRREAVYLFLGWMAIVAGLVVLIVGFRLTMVG